MRNLLNLQRRLLSVATMAALFIMAVPARADLLVSVQNVVVETGSHDSSFEVLLKNTGASVDLAGFSFEVSTDLPSLIMFTSATTNTLVDPYIFAAHSGALNVLELPSIDIVTGIKLEASDFYDEPSGFIALANGSTVSLGRVFFNVSDYAAPGTVGFSVLTSYPATSLSNPVWDDVHIDQLVDGQITIREAQHQEVVPEPTGVLLLLTVVSILLLSKRMALRLVK